MTNNLAYYFAMVLPRHVSLFVFVTNNLGAYHGQLIVLHFQIKHGGMESSGGVTELWITNSFSFDEEFVALLRSFRNSLDWPDCLFYYHLLLEYSEGFKHEDSSNFAELSDDDFLRVETTNQ